MPALMLAVLVAVSVSLGAMAHLTYGWWAVAAVLAGLLVGALVSALMLE